VMLLLQKSIELNVMVIVGDWERYGDGGNEHSTII
jgi:hypothetical protein